MSFSPGDFPNPGIKPRSPTLQVDPLPSEPTDFISFVIGSSLSWAYSKQAQVGFPRSEES